MIPIVSQLAKEAMRRQRIVKAGSKPAAVGAEDEEMEADAMKRKLTEFIEQDADDMETHFVENPFIKIREKASRKQLDGKLQMGADDL